MSTYAGAGWRLLLVLVAAVCVLVAALPDPTRPVVVASVAAVAASVAAAASGRRLAGTGALALVTAAVLLGSALDASDLRPVQVVAAGLLLVVMTATLDRVEQAGQRGVTVARAPAARMLGTPALAVGAASVVSVTAAQTVVPSVGLVLVGIAAAVGALVLATLPHRN